ncbi:MAG: transposase [Bryobacterales bacterium]|nr:transposase [Bryobacterales bacterium]
MDRLLDNARAGPLYLKQPAIAQLVFDAIAYGERELNRYQVHEFVVMANHVHLLITPLVPVPEITRTLKGITSRQANRALGLTGTPFWEVETYDHLVRSAGEFERIRHYILQNPVRAGVVAAPEQLPWSSGSATWTSRAGVDACRT